MRYLSFLLVVIFLQNISPSFAGIEDEIDSTLELMHHWRKTESHKQPLFESNPNVCKRLKESITVTSPFQFVKEAFGRTREKYGILAGHFFCWARDGVLNWPQRMQRAMNLKTQSFIAYAQASNTQTLDSSSEPPSSEDDPKKLFVNWHKKAGTQKVDTAVFVVGNTGAGKSTTIASLMGARLIKIRKGKVDLHPSEDPEKYPKIGLNAASKTSYPEFFESKIANLRFVDCPGLNSTQGDLYDMVRDATLECTIKSIKHPKLLLVMGHPEFTSVRGQGFRDLVSHFSPIFQPDVFDSILWVVTKTTDGWTRDDYLDEIREIEKAVEWKIKKEKGKKWFADLVTSTNSPREAEKNQIKELKELVDLKAMLSSINSTNLLCFDPLNEASRKVLLTSVENLKSTPVSKFRFSSESQGAFKKFSEEVIRDALVLKVRGDNLRNERDRLETNIKFNERRLSQTAVGREQLEEIISREIEEYKRHLSYLQNEKYKIQESSKRIDLSNQKEVCVYEKSIDEKRRMGSFNWTVQQFQYKGVPIKRFEENHDPNGKFRHWNLESTGDESLFKAEYVGGWGQDAFVNVKLFTTFNEQPHIKFLVASWEERARFLEKSISEIKSKLAILENDIKNPAQQSTTQLQVEKNKLIEQKKVKDQELDSIKKKIQEKEDFYKTIHYIRGRLALRNESDPDFQNFLDTF